jgi:hypothetical protein
VFLKQSTAVDVAFGPFLDETDGKTAETGLTITQPDIRLKKNGGAWAQKNAAQTLSHEENGWYEIALDTTDTNTLGILMVAVHEAGALPVWGQYIVLPANVYDSLVSGSATLGAVVGAITGNITGNLSGSVGSVTGAVGSVTGAVGSVTGAVGSVTGAVGSVSGNVGGNVVGSVGSVTGLTASNLDATVSSRLATVGYTAPLTAVTTRSALGLATANLDTQLAAIDTDTGDIAAIKAKTDSLTFTAANVVDANIQWINDVPIVGDGSGTPFNV